MNIALPRPIIKCSKCSSADIVIPERAANHYDPDDMVLLRCRACGHEKRSERKRLHDVSATVGVYGRSTEETF